MTLDFREIQDTYTPKNLGTSWLLRSGGETECKLQSTGSKELRGVKRWPEIHWTKKGQQVKKKSSGDRTGSEGVEEEKQGQEVKLIQAG